MSEPRITDNDCDEISVTLDGKEIRGWSYADETERRTKMLAAREFCEGWFEAAAYLNAWQEINDEADMPPHAVPVLLYSPPMFGHPDGEIEARPFSTGRSGPGWSEYSQHKHATHWRELPRPPVTP